MMEAMWQLGGGITADPVPWLLGGAAGTCPGSAAESPPSLGSGIFGAARLEGTWPLDGTFCPSLGGHRGAAPAWQPSMGETAAKQKPGLARVPGGTWGPCFAALREAAGVRPCARFFPCPPRQRHLCSRHEHSHVWHRPKGRCRPSRQGRSLLRHPQVGWGGGHRLQGGLI